MHPGCSWIYSGSLGSFGSKLVVVWYIQGRWTHSVASLGLLGSFGVVGFIRVRHRGRGFIWGHWFHSGAPSGSLGSFWVARFIRVRPGIVVGFIRVHLCAAVGFIRVLWVHSGARWGLFGSFQVIRGRPCGRWVHSGSFG